MNIIYIITNLINNKQYVGQTTRNLQKRLIEHKYTKNKNEIHLPLHRAIQKYGINQFKVIPIEYSLDELDEMESFWIQKLNTIKPNGYNLTTGGCKNHHLIQETKNKISIAQIGEKNHMYGKIPWNKGKERTEKEKENISLSLIGKMKGIPHTEEHNKKLAESKIGEKNPNFGKNNLWRSEQNKQNIGNKNPNFGNKWTQEQKDAQSKRLKEIKRKKEIKYD